MAKCNVTHACGHRTVHNLFGPYNSRQQRISELERRLCRDCWEAKRDEAHAKENAAAAAKAAEAGLPALEGTPKQIAWAESIRVKAIADAEAAIAATATTAERKAQVAPLLAQLKGENSAAWWIDNRKRTGVQLLMALGRIARERERG